LLARCDRLVDSLTLRDLALMGCVGRSAFEWVRDRRICELVSHRGRVEWRNSGKASVELTAAGHWLAAGSKKWS
jgi:hypothetical protein